MKKVNQKQLRPGMKVAKTVYSPSGQVLITAGMDLSIPWIERLGELGINCVEVEDALLDSIKVIPNAVLQQEVLETRNSFNETIERLVREERINIQPLQSIMDELLGEILLKRTVLSCMHLYRSFGSYLYEQSIRVCILAVLIGVRFNYSQSQLVELSVGALIRDLCMLSIDKDILDKPGALTEEEWAQVMEHSASGHQILKKFVDIPTLSKHVSLHHHERWNGSGYPNGLKGYEIQEYARIVAVADVFAALTEERPYREAYTFDEAVEFLTTMSGYYFESKVVEAFTASILTYPVGSMVLLSSGEIGRIISVNPQVPTRPTLQMIIRSAALYTRYDELVDMYKFPELEVVRMLSERERISVESKVHIRDN